MQQINQPAVVEEVRAAVLAYNEAIAARRPVRHGQNACELLSRPNALTVLR